MEYLDGCGTADGLAVADHLAGCRSCRGEYEALRDVLRLVKEIREPDPGAAFWRENREAIRRAVTKVRGRRARRRLRWLSEIVRAGIPAIGGPATALLAALTVLLGGLALRDSRAPGPGDLHAGFSASDRAALGEAYLEGVLFRSDRPVDDLAWLSAADLAEVFRTMGGGALGDPAVPSDTGWDGYGWGGVEEEIRGLDPEQLERLMESLTTAPARG